MDSHRHFNTSDSQRPVRIPPAGYQVVALHRDRSRSLVTLARNLRAATTLAKAFCDATERSGDRDGIVIVRVEEWVGTLIEGEWVPVSLQHGGFWHRFVTHDSGRRHSGKCDQRSPSLPATGDNVECVLLGEKTRKGGWRARLLKHGAEGPITNTADVPKSAKPGQVVMLRLGAISQDGKRIQFQWQQADNAEHP
jgi:hypothetical protein